MTTTKAQFEILPDRKIAQRIRNRIRWDQRVSISDLQISVRYGHVVLTGTVDSLFRRNAAIEIVSTTEGVLSMDDQIGVPAHFHRSDTEIRNRIEEQIVAIGLGPTERVTVEVVDGYVKLEGIVHTARKKAQSAGIVWELSGVADCLNLIEIGEPPPFRIRTEISKTEKARVFSGDDFIACRTTS